MTCGNSAQGGEKLRIAAAQVSKLPIKRWARMLRNNESREFDLEQLVHEKFDSYTHFQ
jgi:hypothetical protein